MTSAGDRTVPWLKDASNEAPGYAHAWPKLLVTPRAVRAGTDGVASASKSPLP